MITSFIVARILNALLPNTCVTAQIRYMVTATMGMIPTAIITGDILIPAVSTVLSILSYLSSYHVAAGRAAIARRASSHAITRAE